MGKHKICKWGNPNNSQSHIVNNQYFLRLHKLCMGSHILYKYEQKIANSIQLSMIHNMKLMNKLSKDQHMSHKYYFLCGNSVVGKLGNDLLKFHKLRKEMCKAGSFHYSYSFQRSKPYKFHLGSKLECTLNMQLGLCIQCIRKDRGYKVQS